jgi:hypothetical protein
MTRARTTSPTTTEAGTSSVKTTEPSTVPTAIRSPLRWSVNSVTPNSSVSPIETGPVGLVCLPGAARAAGSPSGDGRQDDYGHPAHAGRQPDLDHSCHARSLDASVLPS